MLGPGKFSCSCEGTFVLDQRIREGGEGGVGYEYICMITEYVRSYIHTYLRICMCVSEVQNPRYRRMGEEVTMREIRSLLSTKSANFFIIFAAHRRISSTIMRRENNLSQWDF